jgi:prepilin-type N-terminal cleavage/methylation domain-containing protein
MKRNIKGFTLAELLIAMTIFAFVGILSSEIFLNVTRYNTRLSLERKIYTDARYVMAKIVRELQRNTIDYEEYYNKIVLGKAAATNYSANYGKYGGNFYDLGDDIRGAKCKSVINPFPITDAPCDTEQGQFLNKNTVDTNTGTNPKGASIEADQSKASAFCDQIAVVPPVLCAGASNVQTELYLIDSFGTKKTMLGRELINKLLPVPDRQYALSMMQMDGYDTNDDEVIDTWLCSEDYVCTGVDINDPLGNSMGGKYPKINDLTAGKPDLSSAYNDFIPISPTESTITDLKFIIAPLEDPRKAFAERSNKVQVQPYVTIIMTIEPAPSLSEGYMGEIPSVTFQTTVSTRVFNEVVSF